MFRKRGFLVVGLVLMCVCGVAFCGSKDESKPDPFKDTSVLVEAFMVRVSTEGLVKAGVNPIGNAPDGISILNILWCLSEPGFAEVRSGIKAMACHHEESETSNSRTVYIKNTSASKGKANTVYNSYQTRNGIEVRPYVISTEDVKVYVSYANTDVVKNEDSTGPAATNNFSWQGVITAKSGVPVIASAVQNDESSVSFLVLTATIQNRQELKSEKESDIDRMQGTWKGFEHGVSSNEWTLVIKGNEVQVDGPGSQDYTGTMVTDETRKPKSAKFTVTKCPYKQYIGKVANNIYMFEGGRLIMAGNEPGIDAIPKGFIPGNGPRLFEFKRVKLR